MHLLFNAMLSCGPEVNTLIQSYMSCLFLILNVLYLLTFPGAMKKQRKQQTPEQDALEHIDACRDKPFLEERVIDSFKGR